MQHHYAHHVAHQPVWASPLATVVLWTAVVALADGPGLAPGAVERVVAAWRDGAGGVVAASYGGVRGHPVLLDRSTWDRVPDEGARALEPALVPCDDLGAPGDEDRRR